MAGEVLACGDAEGGMEDVRQLRGWMGLLLPGSTTAQQDERIRWAMLMALTLLQRQRAALDSLAAAIESGCDVSACVQAMEEAAAQQTTESETAQPPRVAR